MPTLALPVLPFLFKFMDIDELTGLGELYYVCVKCIDIFSVLLFTWQRLNKLEDQNFYYKKFKEAVKSVLRILWKHNKVRIMNRLSWDVNLIKLFVFKIKYKQRA